MCGMKKIYAQIRVTILVLLGLVILLATGCTPLHKEVIPTIQVASVYDQLYPYYVEVCAVSQIRAKFAEYGGSGGHAVMYLKGACRDTQAEYPTIEVCDAGTVDLSDPETGVGISVNKLFGNVNWIAVPGKRLFYRGNLEEDQLLDEAHARATIKVVEDLKLFKGVETREYYEESVPEDESEDEFIYRVASDTVGTDFAINFGRTIFCSRLPVTRGMMGKIVENLNEQNRKYVSGETEYKWSGYYNNCSHVLHNSLAAAGVWSSKSVQSYMLKQFFNLSLPANETINLAQDNNADRIILSNADYIDEWDDVYFGYKYLARQYGAWIVTANRYGNEYETIWDGHIEILSPFGDLEVSGKSDEQYNWCSREHNDR